MFEKYVHYVCFIQEYRRKHTTQVQGYVLQAYIEEESPLNRQIGFRRKFNKIIEIVLENTYSDGGFH